MGAVMNLNAKIEKTAPPSQEAIIAAYQDQLKQAAIAARAAAEKESMAQHPTAAIPAPPTSTPDGTSSSSSTSVGGAAPFSSPPRSRESVRSDARGDTSRSPLRAPEDASGMETVEEKDDAE